MNRRFFFNRSFRATIGAGAMLYLPSCRFTDNDMQPFFNVSLAQWSLHRTIRAGKLDTLNFPAKAKKDFDIHAVEYVNQFFSDKVRDRVFLGELKQRTTDLEVKNLLIMIDDEGDLGSPVRKTQLAAVENHYKWVEAAQFLGCHSIRVNAYGEGSSEEVAKASVESLAQLSSFAEDYDINVIVENHQSHSANGNWVSSIIKKVNRQNCGTLPDFGNFYDYDRYQGVQEMMPFAKAVSAKSHHFDQNGNETQTDYVKMLQIVKDSGYSGYIGIEYEGQDNDEDKGIRMTKDLLLNAAKKVV